MAKIEARSAWKPALHYLSEVIQNRLAEFFGKPLDVKAFSFSVGNGLRNEVQAFAQHHHLSPEEYLLLLIALAPHLQSDFFDRAIKKNLPEAGDFPQIGGSRGKQFRGFLPTGETALFLLAGNELENRFKVQQIFIEYHFFSSNILLLL